MRIPTVPSGPGDGAKFLFYPVDEGQTRLPVRVAEETVWLSQRQMAELFQKDVRTINEHIQNLYQEDELATTQDNRRWRGCPLGRSFSPRSARFLLPSPC